MIAGNRLLQRLGPVMRWAAQEDLIPTNFVPDIRKAPEQKRTRKLTDAEIRQIWRACGDISAAARRRRTSAAWFASCWSRRSGATRRPRCGMATSSTASGGRPTTSRADRTVSSCRRWRCQLVGQGGARDFVFAGSVGKISGFSKLKIALDEAVRRHRLAAARSAPDRGVEDAGPRHPQPHRAGGVESRGARCRRHLSARRTRNAEGRGAGDMGRRRSRRSSARGGCRHEAHRPREPAPSC